ncbi:YceD family protein [Pasteuria penetrans]|uniref:YceD family protein n=1 Tax=Pasteuria penetrans TaxID=86005 RepID=UPI000FB9C198|nr:DUF177 domain-containing protein [Pasteuria penetrans]
MRIVLPDGSMSAPQKHQGVVTLDALVDDVLELVSLQPITVRAVGVRCRDRFRVDAKQETVAELSCARCLGTFARPLCSTWSESFPGDEKGVDLTSRVQEALLLELPMIAICHKDCPGLCIACGERVTRCSCSGEEEGPDPRWRDLSSWEGV